MSVTKTNIILNASAAAAAIGSLAYTANLVDDDGEKYKIKLTNTETQYSDTIKAGLNNITVQAKIRQHVPWMLSSLEVNPDEMEDLWIRIAALDVGTDVVTGVIEPGGVDGVGKLIGPNQDSVLDDRVSSGTGVQSCYSNCHAACHGSRGWR